MPDACEMDPNTHVWFGSRPVAWGTWGRGCLHKYATLTNLIQRLRVNRVKQLQGDTADDEFIWLGRRLVVTGIGWWVISLTEIVCADFKRTGNNLYGNKIIQLGFQSNLTRLEWMERLPNFLLDASCLYWIYVSRGRRERKHTSCSAGGVFWEWIIYQSPRGSFPFIIVINAAARPCFCF